MLGDQELEDRLNSIEERLNRLERSRPGIGSGGDTEYFGQHIQLETLSQKVEALIRFLEKSYPEIRQNVEGECTKARNAEEENLKNQIDSAVFGDTHD
ncbi:MAG: hypothetical protein ABSH01_03205 [Terriglobia bacterium]|jgi:hypothetical protein